MRVYTILLMGVLLLAAVPAQAADGKEKSPKLMARLVGELLERAGITLSGDGNELKPTLVDGKGNTVLNIGELVVNINVGDVSIEKERSGGGPGAEGSGRAFGWGWPGNRMAPGWTPGYRDRFSRESRPENRAGLGEAWPQRGPHDWRGEFWGPEAAGEIKPPPGPRPEVMELLMQVPPDVEPEFVEFIMHVGQLAREHPRFREALEKLVEQAEAHLAEEAAAEH